MPFGYRRKRIKPKLNEKKAEDIRKLARQLIIPRVNYYSKKLNIYPNRVFIRIERSRWGSCSSSRNIGFNALLALTPEVVIDSVVIHELCHLKYMDHQEDFWNLVYTQMPKETYKQCKKYLKEHQIDLMSEIWDIK